MKLDATDCEILSLDSGIIDCPVTQNRVPVLFVTIRVSGQPEAINLAVRNPHRLANDLPAVICNSRVLSGDGEFIPENWEEEE